MKGQADRVILYKRDGRIIGEGSLGSGSIGNGIGPIADDNVLLRVTRHRENIANNRSARTRVDSNGRVANGMIETAIGPALLLDLAALIAGPAVSPEVFGAAA